MSKAQATAQTRPELDEYEACCKLIALAVLLGNIHRHDSCLTSNECYGIELFLKEIANEIDPNQCKQKGGAA